MSTLISATDLAALLDGGEVRVLDVQYTLAGDGPSLYAAAHLPGVPHLSLDDVLAGPPGAGGRHPLPSAERLEAGLRAVGVREGEALVVYDQQTSLAAARAWWVLRWAGVADVRVLDGGLAVWQAAGLPVTTEVPEVSPGDVVVRPGSVPVLDAGGAARVAADGILLDSRAGERFRGETEPIDAVAGHIPGARNAPMGEQLEDDGRFRSGEELRAYFAGLGVDDGVEVGTTCGSGVTASHTALALHLAGFEATPYIGSWSEWITDESRPIATGPAD
ncbi:thiosulfate/3-mercaptopyruvate sulfurtransferase [Knoellia remsis]|uniref:Thiosulfate/3-mercaptopyruvate sulfurtransferase n=1 Tax=Knoellia remsis TaxID=407159 RepID=A0A2T0V0V9_9MICO|nr:sulfurtransferase [Knoellia remsis]PRY63737.1 thiosulfate/3-mercaptopyruvate sulfurtransferase [Knoellia remsis]